ncbi:MAG: hypothetical protein ABIZ57_12115 [Candidatus Limnocylindria bacterium]
MSLFKRALRPPPIVSDEAIERYLTSHREQIEPDPLYRRRLRTDVVNRFVAAREGIDSASRPSLVRREMGRVGRACLYASFTLGVSAASVLAASQEAKPGEVLYPLKQRIEQLRVDVLPPHLHGELAAYALGERIDEMGWLAEAGHLELVAAMGPAIDREYARLVTLGASVDAAGATRIERHLIVLEGLLAKLPPNARDAVRLDIDGSAGTRLGNSRNLDPGTPRGVTPAAGGAAAPFGSPTPSPTAKPARAAKPDPTAAAAPTPTPKPKPDRTPEPRPDPTPRFDPSPPGVANGPNAWPEAQSTP